MGPPSDERVQELAEMWAYSTEISIHAGTDEADTAAALRELLRLRTAAGVVCDKARVLDERADSVLVRRELIREAARIADGIPGAQVGWTPDEAREIADLLERVPADLDMLENKAECCDLMMDACAVVCQQIGITDSYAESPDEMIFAMASHIDDIKAGRVPLDRVAGEPDGLRDRVLKALALTRDDIEAVRAMPGSDGGRPVASDGVSMLFGRVRWRVMAALDGPAIQEDIQEASDGN